MKIRIDDEYSELGDDFSIIVNDYSDNEYSENEEELQLNYEFEENNKPKMENRNMFNVEIQYSEDGSNEEYSIERHKDYDNFYKKVDGDTNINRDLNNNQQYYTEEIQSENNYFESISDKNYKNNSSERISKVRVRDSEDLETLSEKGLESYEKSCELNYNYNLSSMDDSYNLSSMDDSYNLGSMDDSYCEEIYQNNYEDTHSVRSKKYCIERKGEVGVTVRLDNKNGVEIKGAKVNLYSLNGVCPKLHESKLTDCNGQVLFDNLENGCYRVISIVDRRYFEKPIYTTWNEIIIDKCVKEASIGVVNKIKKACYKR